MAVTIKDIAKKLGVSATAVSKALNDRDDVSDELKARVRKAAEEMDYSANSIAKRLVTNKSNTIGVFVLSRQEKALKDNIGSEFIGGILEEANKNGYDIVLFSTDSDLLSKKSYLKLCKERRVEGAVFCGLRLDDPHIKEIENTHFPIAIIDTYVKGKKVGYISTDNRSGVKKALEYLWKLGHRKITMINGHENAQVSKIRYKAFKDFMVDKGAFREDYIFTGDFTKESGFACGEKILKLKDLPTAVFAASDYMALGAMKAFRKNGLELPRDISVVGFDNILLGEYIEPPLTTVGQDTVAMGREAVRWVLSKLKGKEIESVRMLKPELIIRESCYKLKRHQG